MEGYFGVGSAFRVVFWGITIQNVWEFRIFRKFSIFSPRPNFEVKKREAPGIYVSGPQARKTPEPKFYVKKRGALGTRRLGSATITQKSTNRTLP